jgi:hypothetical protein
VPVADSKALKLSNDHAAHHPLIHLERGVLAFLRWLESAPETDGALFERLGANLESHPWYAGEATPLPVGQTSAEIAIAASRLAGALESAGVELVAMRCLAVGESAVNRAVNELGTKAEATAMALGNHLRHIWSLAWGPTVPAPTEPGTIGARTIGARGGDHLRIVCDQLGGRTMYDGLLARELPGATVVRLGESGERSRYRLADEGGREGVIQFMPEAESAHLPVALASMIAKYVRELAMARFNRYWCGRMPELKPTAGYNTDAGRWLRDAADVLSREDRAAMVRIS